MPAHASVTQVRIITRNASRPLIVQTEPELRANLHLLYFQIPCNFKFLGNTAFLGISKGKRVSKFSGRSKFLNMSDFQKNFYIPRSFRIPKIKFEWNFGFGAAFSGTEPTDFNRMELKTKRRRCRSTHQIMTPTIWRNMKQVNRRRFKNLIRSWNSENLDCEMLVLKKKGVIIDDSNNRYLGDLVCPDGSWQNLRAVCHRHAKCQCWVTPHRISWSPLELYVGLGAWLGKAKSNDYSQLEHQKAAYELKVAWGMKPHHIPG